MMYRSVGRSVCVFYELVLLLLLLLACCLACWWLACWLAGLLMHLVLLPQAHGFVPKLIDCGFAHLLTEEQAAEQAKGNKSMFTMGSTARGVIGTQVLFTMIAL